ncbi:MAG: class I SAM-dependent methyltransferase [Thermococci archaeon]|nr:class I SAM-dependent methyltransferase [Thermococci archaeon]
MTLESYVYPDRKEELTSKLIDSYGKARWTIEEAYVLNLVMRRVRARRPRGVELSLDAGTGLGRLIPFLLRFSRRVVAVDPDDWRLSNASERFKGRKNVFFARAKASELGFLPDGSVGFVNFSHIAQHIPHHELVKTLGEMYRVLEPGAHLLFLTTHSEAEEMFVVSEEGGASEISEEEFERLASNPVPGKLPVRKFDVDALEELFRATGFRVEGKVYYHIKPEYAPSGTEGIQTPDLDGAMDMLTAPTDAGIAEVVRSIIKTLEDVNSSETDARKKALDVAFLLRRNGG